jgi:chromosome segregation ATPase
MQAQTLWSRMGSWLRVTGRNDGNHPEMGHVAISGANRPLSTDPDSGHKAAPFHAQEAIIAPTSRALSKRELTLERLHDGYQRAVDVIETIQEHLKRQDERGAAMVQALTRLADDLSHLPESSQAQQLALSGIREQLEAESVRGRRLDENLAQWPRIADAQREMIVSVRHELDNSRKSTDHLDDTLKDLCKTMSALDETTGTSSTVLRQMHAESSVREERLAALLDRQTRQFTWLSRVTITIAVLAVATSLVALVC